MSRPLCIVKSYPALEPDGKWLIPEQDFWDYLDRAYSLGFEDGRNKALAEEYVKMTTLQMNIDNIGVSE